MTGPFQHPRRPAFLRSEPPATDSGAGDPAQRWEAAYRTASALIAHGRNADDEEVARLVALTEQIGVDELAEIWATCPSDSLPGALWRLYLVRAGIRHDPRHSAAMFAAGRARAEVDTVVAGVADPRGPEEVMVMADAVLTGVFTGDLSIALERAAAYCRIVSTGLAVLSDEADEREGSEQLRRAASLATTGRELAAAAAASRAGHLEEGDDWPTSVNAEVQE